MEDFQKYPNVMLGAVPFWNDADFMGYKLATLYKEILKNSGSEDLALSVSRSVADAVIARWFE